MTVRRTRRFRGMNAVALITGGAAMIATRPGLLLAAVVAVAFAAYPRIATPPSVGLDVERTVSDPDPAPGDEVRVTVTATNEGDATLPDLRLVDGVPGALEVVSGSPRLGTALRPGKRARFSYTVAARRGTHEFGPLLVVARDFAGAVERETRVECATELTCSPPLVATEEVPLRAQTTGFTGRVPTDVGGSGVEFHATRRYRRGDSLSRIDWKRHARTGQLTTLEFREERAATVALVIDAREAAYVAPADREPSAVDHAVRAAGSVYDALLESGDRVGIASFGPHPSWLDPGTGQDHRARARAMLASDPAFGPTPTNRPFRPSVTFNGIRGRLPADAQVVLFSPLADDYVESVARRLDAYGHAVTVVSPDATASKTAGQRLARVERALRLNRLRGAGIRVIDWNPGESIGASLERAKVGWSR